MAETEPTAHERLLGIALLQGLIGLAAVGSLLCSVIGVRALLGAPSALPLVLVFPAFFGAFVVIGASVLLLHAQGVAGGSAYLEWIWKHVPKSLLLLSAVSFVFSWQVFEHMPDHPRGSSARAPVGADAELFIGFATVFYVYGGSILVGGLRALNRK